METIKLFLKIEKNLEYGKSKNKAGRQIFFFVKVVPELSIPVAKFLFMLT